MKKIKKLLTVIILLMGISVLLSGCEKTYTEKERIKFAQKKLSDKYGEEFEITYVFNADRRWFNVYAYSVNHPDVIFEASYDMEWSSYSEYDYDFYIEELVAEQYKKLVDEQLRNCGYDYYIDSRCAMIVDNDAPLTDTSMTMEEYSKLSEHVPRFAIYFTNELLVEDNETIYALLKDVTSVADCGLGFYIVTKDDLKKIEEEYSETSVLRPEFLRYLDSRYNLDAYKSEDRGYFGFRSIDGEWNRTEEEFYTIMEVIRNNELFK